MVITAPPILLVEDNPDDEMLTIRALQQGKLGHPILVAHNGQEALDLINRQDPLPIVVLLDLKLPKIDGLEVLQYIRATPRTQCLPVVVLTSSNEERDIVESYQGGANSYVCKPVEFTEFVQAISQLGLYWVTPNQPLPKG